MINLTIYRFNEQLRATVKQGLQDGVPAYIMQYLLKELLQNVTGMTNDILAKEAQEEQEKINAAIQEEQKEEG